MRSTTMTQKGQVTIPADVRKALGLKPRDRVSFEVDAAEGVAVLRRAAGSVADVYGSVQPRERPENFQRLREEFEQGVADEVTRTE